MASECQLVRKRQEKSVILKMQIKFMCLIILDSPYRQQISKAILRLQEDGTIANLTELWWKTKNTDENGNSVDCEAGESTAGDTPELGMDNVGGVFLVLGVGLVLAVFVGLLEFMWSVRQTSIEERVI